MAVADKKQTQEPGQEEQLRPEEELVPQQAVFVLPNSVLASMPTPPPPPGTPNSVMREMLEERGDPAEAEANRLSAGITRGTPNSVRREMGSRLNADFSSVHFHEGSESVRQNESMGSLAYTRGSDVYFGRGGFNPMIAAHELVHTVQQRAVPGHVSQSVAFGTVQMWKLRSSLIEKFKSLRRSKSTPLLGDFAPPPQAVFNRSDDAPFDSVAEDYEAPPPSLTGTQNIENQIPSRTVSEPLPETQPAEVDPEEPVVLKPTPVKADITGGNADSSSPTPELEKTPSTDIDEDESESESDSPSPAPAGRAEDLPDHMEFQSEGNWYGLSRGGTFTTTVPRRADGQHVSFSSKYAMYYAITSAGEIEVYAGGEWRKARPVRPASPVGSSTMVGRSNSAATEDLTPADIDEIEDDDTPVLTSSPHNDTDAGGANLPNATRIFGTGRRWRMSRTALTDEQIDGMVAYFKEYERTHRHRDFPTSPKIVSGPIQSALQAASDAAGSSLSGSPQADDLASPTGTPVLSTSPMPDSESPAPNPDMDDQQVPSVLPYGDYHAQGGGWKTSKTHTGNAVAAQNVGMAVNAFGRQGVLLNNYKYHVSSDAKDNLPIWDESKWKLPTSDKPSKDSSGNIVSRGDYDPYVNYVAPIAGTALGLYGAGTGIANMVHGVHDTIRHAQNVEAGASRWDAAQAGIDTIGAAASTMSSIWGTVQNIGNIGSAATSTFGEAVNAIPGLGIVTGAASAITGTSQAIRGRATRSELNAAGEELDRIAALQQQSGNPAPAPAPGQLTDQQKLEAIMKQGHQTAVYNMWSGGMKAAAGGLTAAAGISSLVGAAPVAAGIQAVTAVLNVVRFTFERVYKARMRNSIVGEEFDINWSEEMNDVRDMIQEHNPKFNIRDKDVRMIILKAHGSTDTTRTAAYNTIKLNRARYLINTATDANNAFHKVAEMVIEAMGVHKRGGNNYAAGADRLLAEKLG